MWHFLRNRWRYPGGMIEFQILDRHAIDMPVASPDLNPVGHLWDIMYQHLHRLFRSWLTPWSRSWAEIPQETICCLIRSTSRQCREFSSNYTLWLTKIFESIVHWDLAINCSVYFFSNVSYRYDTFNSPMATVKFRFESKTAEFGWRVGDFQPLLLFAEWFLMLNSNSFARKIALLSATVGGRVYFSYFSCSSPVRICFLIDFNSF